MTPLRAAQRVAFHIQVSARVGIGHLARSTAVFEGLAKRGIDAEVHLDADPSGRTIATSKGLIPRRLPRPPAAIIIDATNLAPSVRSRVAELSPRILISPVFEHPEVATHVLVRDANGPLRDGLAESAELVTDPDFAFVTATGLRPAHHEYDRLIVGICLSGGVASHDVENLIGVVASCERVKEVRVIDRQMPNATRAVQTPITHVPTTSQPWDFFHGVNLFVGGDGIMVAEAIAQAIPTISLTSDERHWKNDSLVASGAVERIRRAPLDTARLQHLLESPERLCAMHASALALDGPSRAGALVNRLAQLLRTVPT